MTSWSAGDARTADGTAGAVGTAGPLRLTFAAYQQHTAVKAQRSYRIRLTRAELALTKTAPRHAAKKPAATAAATESVVPTPSQNTPAPRPTKPANPGSPQQIAQGLLSSFGWSSSQFACLNPLWEHESGWSLSSQNAGSGAYGIPQALPGSRMASAGPDWQTNATTQIKWGLKYIKSTYGSPCAAWSHEQATGWY